MPCSASPAAPSSPPSRKPYTPAIHGIPRPPLKDTQPGKWPGRLACPDLRRLTARAAGRATPTGTPAGSAPAATQRPQQARRDRQRLRCRTVRLGAAHRPIQRPPLRHRQPGQHPRPAPLQKVRQPGERQLRLRLAWPGGPHRKPPRPGQTGPPPPTPCSCRSPAPRTPPAPAPPGQVPETAPPRPAPPPAPPGSAVRRPGAPRPAPQPHSRPTTRHQNSPAGGRRHGHRKRRPPGGPAPARRGPAPHRPVKRPGPACQPHHDQHPPGGTPAPSQHPGPGVRPRHRSQPAAPEPTTAARRLIRRCQQTATALPIPP